MSIDKKILEELKRFNQINTYVLKEQAEDAPPPPDAAGGLPTDLPPPPADAAGDIPPPPADAAAGAPPADAAATEVPEPVDVENDPDVDVVDDKKEDEGEGDTEELDITDLVTTQQEIRDKQDEFMDNIFSKLDDLQGKLEAMDGILQKIDGLESKIEKMRPKTPEEKLELRSLDSGPFKQKLSDFFDEKKSEMEETGKNEYVLTSDEVENFSPSEIKKTFNVYDDEEEL
jgi:hypothetical protein